MIDGGEKNNLTQIRFKNYDKKHFFSAGHLNLA